MIKRARYTHLRTFVTTLCFAQGGTRNWACLHSLFKSCENGRGVVVRSLPHGRLETLIVGAGDDADLGQEVLRIRDIICLRERDK